MMLKLTDEQSDWLVERIPKPRRSPKGGHPPADPRKVVGGIFWILDNGAKWKDLPKRFGPKSTVHRWFQRWVNGGAFEAIMQDAGRCVEQRDCYRLYACFIDGAFSKARGGGDGIGCTKAGTGVTIMVLVDARELPVAVDTTSASPHESLLVQRLFDFMLTSETPLRVIGDKAYDSDRLDETLAQQGIEMIAPHRRNRKSEHITQDSRPLRRYDRPWKVERTISWFQNFSKRPANPVRPGCGYGAVIACGRRRCGTGSVGGGLAGTSGRRVGRVVR